MTLFSFRLKPRSSSFSNASAPGEPSNPGWLLEQPPKDAPWSSNFKSAPSLLLHCLILVVFSSSRLLADTPTAPRNIFDMTPDAPASRPAAPGKPPANPAAPPSKPHAPAPPPEVNTTPPTPPPPPIPDAPAAPNAPTPPSAPGNTEANGPTLLPAPTDAEINAATKLVKDLYGKELAAAKTPEKMLDLSDKLLTDGAAEKVDHVAQFAVLLTARDLGLKAGDLHQALKAVNLLASIFKIDSLLQQAGIANSFRARPIAVTDRRFICLQIQSIADTASAAHRYDLMPGLDDTMHSIAAGSGDALLIKQMRKVAEDHAAARSAYDATAVSRKSLKANPQDAAACTIVGRYDCFDSNDWKNGLPLLAAGSDEKLKQAAKSELDDGLPDSIATSADLWWAIAEARPEGEKHRIRSHCVELYAAAVDSLNGLQKAVASKRMNVGKSASPDVPEVVDLLRFADPSHDTVGGNWSVDQTLGSLHASGTGEIGLAYHPPLEYDYRVCFTRVSGKDALNVICLGGTDDRQFVYTLAGWGNSVSGLNLLDCKFPDVNPSGVHGIGLTNGPRQTLIIHMRSDSVAITLDDRPFGPTWRTDFRDLCMLPVMRLKRPDIVGIASYDSGFDIHSACLVEISGHGHREAQNEMESQPPALATLNYTSNGNNGQPFNVTLYANGRADTAFDHSVSWSMRGNVFALRWGDIIDTCKLSTDRKSFTGKNDHNESVHGQVTEGSL